MSIDAKRHREVGAEIIRLVGLKGQNWRKVVITLESPSPRIGVVMEAWAEPQPVLPTFDEWVEAYLPNLSDHWCWNRAGNGQDQFLTTLPVDVYDALGMDDCGDQVGDRVTVASYDGVERRNAALRDALLRLGKIRE